MPQLICLSPQTVSGLVDSLVQFINHGLMDAAAHIAQFLARCPPPYQPPASKPHVCPLRFPAPTPRKRRRRRRRRPRTSRPLLSSFKSQLSTEVDEVIKSIEQLPVVKSHNQEEKRFRRFDMHRMCRTIDMLAEMYLPEHPQHLRTPTLAIMYHPGLYKADVAATYSNERNASDAQSALNSPPSSTRTETLEQPRAMSPAACTQSSDREAAASALVCRPPTLGIIPCLSHDCPDQSLFMCEPTTLEASEISDGNTKKSESNPVHDANPNIPPQAQESALQLPPGVVITDVADMIKFGVKNLLAIAVATEINFKQADNVKKIIAKTEPPLNKVERGHVTGAQSTLSPAAECSSSTPEEISCSKGEKHSIEEFDYNESTGTFSLREREIIFATPKLKAEALAQYRAAKQSTSSTLPPQPPKTARPQSRELQNRVDFDLEAPANFRAREPKLTYGKLKQRSVRGLGKPPAWTMEALNSLMEETFTRPGRGIYWSKLDSGEKMNNLKMVNWSTSFPGQSPPSNAQLGDIAGTWSTWA